MSQACLFAHEPIKRTADISACGRYRYSLGRRWEIHATAVPYRRPVVDRVVLFVMLNPSTADAAVDDPTIRRCMGFAEREGCNAIRVVNLYALRATDPKALAADPDPVGARDDEASNDDWIETLADQAHIIIAAWGASGPKGWQDRAARVLELLRRHGDVYCLGTTAAGAPRHPLYIAATTPLQLLAQGPDGGPIPLAAPDGRVFAYACRFCLQVRVSGSYMTRVEPRPEDLAHRLADARRCCTCETCGAVEVGCVLRCSACEAVQREKDRPAAEARAREEEAAQESFAASLTLTLRTWDHAAPAPWPLTVTHGRDGLAFVAFPLDLEDVPSEVSERVEAARWLCDNAGAPFGRGETPEEAVADLRKRAAAIQAATPLGG